MYSEDNLSLKTIENKILLEKYDHCDKYDYLSSIACGVIGGIIDIFLVGAPKDSKLVKWTDSQIDNVVKKFATISGWCPKEVEKDGVASAIGFLERKYKVNYDQRYSSDVSNLFSMSTRNHHIMSLSHSPDIFGLFFSILNQFTSTSTFIANGSLISIKTDTYELVGRNLISKIFCGVANWLGHLMSDIAGSSGSRGNNGRGSGIGLPFYELFGFCKFGKFNIGKDKQDLATVATRAFQDGYEFRFGLATAIPVVITDLLIRLVWSIRNYFQYGNPIDKCIPNSKKDSLRVMLIFGNCTLCIMDGLDAGLRSGGNFLKFFMRLNLIAWLRLLTLVLKEVYLRIGIKGSLQNTIDAYKRINEALVLYLNELKDVDIELFKLETEKYNETMEIFINAKSDAELREMLLLNYKKLGIDKSWDGDFDKHMSNKKGRLVFG